MPVEKTENTDCTTKLEEFQRPFRYNLFCIGKVTEEKVLYAK